MRLIWNILFWYIDDDDYYFISFPVTDPLSVLGAPHSCVTTAYKGLSSSPPILRVDTLTPSW